MNYKPDYDTTIGTRTTVERLNTFHRKGIDWSYPFDDPEHTAGMCCSDEEKARAVGKQKAWLLGMEQGGEWQASTYGGWPRIYQDVIQVGMASCWPYWKPRPTVLVRSALGGVEWYDWRSLTGAKRKNEEPDHANP